MDRPLILVTGATGYVGGRLVPRLLERGCRVRCMARNPDHLRGRVWAQDVEIVQGDALDPASLKHALAGVDTAYYLIHSLLHGFKEFEEIDRIAAGNFGAAARAAGIERIVYLGGLGESNHALSRHLKSRQEVGDILRASQIPVTEFRAAIIVGSGSISFEMIRYLVERLPIILSPKWISTRCQPICIRDVLSYLFMALDEPRSIGKIVEIGGADILTYEEMLIGYAQVRGLKRYILPLPLDSVRYFSYWVGLLTPIPSSIARNLIEGLKNEVVCRNKSAEEFFPIKPVGYQEALKLALARISEGRVETIWSHAPALLRRGDYYAQSLESREGLIIETHQEEVFAPSDKVFKVFAAIGGRHGWFYADWVWKLRAMLDRVIGGFGMRRGRRNPDSIAAGDVIDFWRVEEIVPRRLMRLRSELKLRGRGWLQFESAPFDSDPSRSIFTLTVFFETKGLMGHLYWYLLYPAHVLLFRGLCRRIKELSEMK